MAAMPGSPHLLHHRLHRIHRLHRRRRRRLTAVAAIGVAGVTAFAFAAYANADAEAAASALTAVTGVTTNGSAIAALILIRLRIRRLSYEGPLIPRPEPRDLFSCQSRRSPFDPVPSPCRQIPCLRTEPRAPSETFPLVQSPFHKTQSQNVHEP
jgi:hypothetical protein